MSYTFDVKRILREINVSDWLLGCHGKCACEFNRGHFYGASGNPYKHRGKHLVWFFLIFASILNSFAGHFNEFEKK